MFSGKLRDWLTWFLSCVKQRIEKDLMGLELRLRDLKADVSPYKVYINQTVPMLENRWKITESRMV